MFGIMRPQSCGTTAEQYSQYRMHYCGTCKAMGTQYGQHTRVMLNFDAVFLAEMLAHLAGENAQDWKTNFKSGHCMTMPKDAKALSPSLQYAASANVLLAALKVDDDLHDSKSSWAWNALDKLYRKPFRKAEADLKTKGLNTEEVWQLAQEQRRRELQHDCTDIEYFAYPTARMAGLVFEAGGAAEHGPFLYNVGFSLGKLAYVLDAWEDESCDAKRGHFNAIAATVGFTSDDARKMLLRLQNEVSGHLEAYLSADAAFLFKNRLKAAIFQKLSSPTPARLPWKEALRQRAQYARERAQQVTQKAQGAMYHWSLQTYSYTLTLAIFALPRTADHLEPPQEGAPLKWMAMLTAILAAAGLIKRGCKSATKRRRGGKNLVPPKHTKDCCNDCFGNCGDCCGNCCDNISCGDCCAGMACGLSCCDSCCSGDHCCGPENCCGCHPCEDKDDLKLLLIILGVSIFVIAMGVVLAVLFA